MQQVLIVLYKLSNLSHREVLIILYRERLARLRAPEPLHSRLHQLPHLQLALERLVARAPSKNAHVALLNQVVPAHVEVLELLIVADRVDELGR